MFNDLLPSDWHLGVPGIEFREGIWKLDLSADWSTVKKVIEAKHQWDEQAWLPWQLWQAYVAFKQCNDRAVLYYGREVVGSVVGDDELLGGQLTNRCN